MGTKPVAVLFLLLLWLAAESRADTIWLVNESHPIYGIVQTSDDDSIRFRQTSDGKKFQTVSISKSSIESLVVNFDSRRLSSLTPGDWQAWHEYAEELFAQQQDPVARNLARRLLVIIAENSDEPARRNAALGELIALTGDPSDRAKLELLRYIQTGARMSRQGDRPPAKKPSDSQRIAAAEFVKAIRLAKAVSPQESEANLRQTMFVFSEICSWQELMNLSKSNRIDKNGLRRLVALEYALRQKDAVVSGPEASRRKWHLLAESVNADSFSLPSIEAITGFDPAAFQFGDGQWLRPRR